MALATALAHAVPRAAVAREGGRQQLARRQLRNLLRRNRQGHDSRPEARKAVFATALANVGGYRLFHTGTFQQMVFGHPKSSKNYPETSWRVLVHREMKLSSPNLGAMRCAGSLMR